MRSGHLLLKLLGFALMSIIISVGVIGVSYSYFTGTNEIISDVSMGDIDVVFSRINTIQGNQTDPSCVIEARIVDSGKNIEINIANAFAGYTATICYEVTNNGSVPVKYQIIQPYGMVDNPIQLNISENAEYIRRNGGKSQGQIIITVSDDIEACDNYCLYTELNFQQAVVEIR